MTLWDYLGLSRTILFQSSLGLLETIWDYWRLSGTIWDYLGLSGIIWDYLEIYLTIWDYLGVSGCKQKQERAMHCYLKLFPYPFFFTHAIPREARAPKKSVIQAFYNFSLVESNAKISLKRSVLKSKAISDFSFQLN